MPTVYVPDVPEFASLGEVAARNPQYRVQRLGGYVVIEAEGELVFGRKELGFKPALWYSAFTGGLDGRIVEFGRDTVRIVDRQP